MIYMLYKIYLLNLLLKDTFWTPGKSNFLRLKEKKLKYEFRDCSLLLEELDGITGINGSGIMITPCIRVV